MSASADYGVTIAEDFTPPTNWIPGQKVDKNVGVVNTGNVDAFVRMYMEGEMKILNQSSTATAKWDGAKFAIGSTDIASTYFNKATGSGIGDTTDAQMVALNLIKSHTDSTSKLTTYFKMLDKTAVDNPLNSTITTNQSTNPAGLTSKYSEVQSIQAGGILAYAPNNAEYEYVLNQDTWLNVVTGDNNTSTYVNVPKGTRVVVAQTAKESTLSDDGKSIKTYAGTTGGVNTVYVAVQASAAAFKPVNVDTEIFKPLTAGLYLFARNVALTGASSSSAITSDYEFSGYYYSNFDTVYNATDNTFAHTEKNAVDNTSATTITKGNFGEGTYYALRYELNLYIHMHAPAYNSEYTFTLNDSSYYFKDYVKDLNGNYQPSAADRTFDYSNSNIATVTIGQRRTVEVVKKLPEGEVTPELLKNAEFTFKIINLEYTISDKLKAVGGQIDENAVKPEENIVSNIGYRIYKVNQDGTRGNEIDATFLHTTNEDGEFKLKYGEMAVFDEIAAYGADTTKYDFDNFKIIEESVPYWLGIKSVEEITGTPAENNSFDTTTDPNSKTEK